MVKKYTNFLIYPYLHLQKIVECFQSSQVYEILNNAGIKVSFDNSLLDLQRKLKKDLILKHT